MREEGEFVQGWSYPKNHPVTLATKNQSPIPISSEVCFLEGSRVRVAAYLQNSSTIFIR
jgi:hypothetical protein